MRRMIPEEDCIYTKCLVKITPEYDNGVFCKCGHVIYFKNRKPYESVFIKCSKCNSVISYG